MKIHLKILPILSILLLFPGCFFAQKDTLYYDAQWKPTEKGNAAYFRPPVVKIGDAYQVKDFYSSGQLQMEASSLFADKDFWQGKVVWYNADGSKFQEGMYTKNRLNGEFKTKLKDQWLSATYKNGRMVEGKQNHVFDNAGRYIEFIGDTIKTVNYGKDISGIRSETYGTREKYEVYTKYFGTNGAYIGKSKQLPDNAGTKGLQVTYGRNPMYVREIRYYRDGKTLGYSVFYQNGSPRELFKSKPPYSKTYFTRKGEELGQLTYVQQKYYLKANEGKDILFYPNKNGTTSDIIREVRTYEEGQLTDEKRYYENQILKSQSAFENGYKSLVVAYDSLGKAIHRMEYKSGLRHEGTEVDYNKKLVYKAGELLEEATYYHNTDLVFSIKTPGRERYFDMEGNTLGELELDTVASYPKPLKGKRIYLGYQNTISSIEEYTKGVLAKTTAFRERKVGEQQTETFKTETYYGPKGYETKKKVHYYSNGKKQSEVSYKEYKEQKGIFYDDKGAVLGRYDYLKKEGTLYTFFADSDKVKLFKVEQGGQVSQMRRYDYGSQSGAYGTINAVLVEEIDASCCGTFYSREGEELAKVKFKDGKPWEGTVYDYKSLSKYSIKAGKREGSYVKYGYNRNILEEGNYANDLKTGIFSYYDNQEQLQKTETYAVGTLDGTTQFYDANGAVSYSMEYNNGLPVAGTRLLFSYGNKKPTEETYVEGKLIKLVAYDENGKRVTDYVNGKAQKSVAYHGETNIKRLSFSVKNSYLDGEVLRYNEQGQPTHKAIFKDGRLLSGELLLSNANRKVVGGVTYIYLKRRPDRLAIKFYGTDDKVLFQAEEDLVFGTNTVFMQSLGVYMDYITPNNLY